MRVKVLRTNDGLEFCNELFDNYSKEHVLRHRMVRYTSQQNFGAEIINMTLIDKVRCMLISSSLPKMCWGKLL